MGMIQELIREQQEDEQKRMEAEAEKRIAADMARKAEEEQRKIEEAKRREEEAKRRAEEQRQAEEKRIERDRLAREERLKKCEAGYVAYLALAMNVENFLKRAEAGEFVRTMGFSGLKNQLDQSRRLLAKEADGIRREIMSGQRC